MLRCAVFLSDSDLCGKILLNEIRAAAIAKVMAVRIRMRRVISIGNRSEIQAQNALTKILKLYNNSKIFPVLHYMTNLIIFVS